MSSQWDYFLKNLGEWQGSFTRFSPQGEEVKDTPSIVTLEETDNKGVHQVVRYLPHNQPASEIQLDYSYNSLNRSILFFESGAFAQGSMQLGVYSTFGGEFGLIHGDRRLRMVQLYDREAKFQQAVLIREKLSQSQTPEQPQLTVDSLLGEWHGEAITMYADWRTGDRFSTKLHIQRQDSNHIQQTLSFGNQTISSTAKIEGSRLIFTDSKLPIQILLLPDGASCNCPLEIKLSHNFVLETGWLFENNKRQRIMRNYNDKGNWVSCTWLTETKII